MERTMESSNQVRRGAAWKKLLVGATCLISLAAASSGTASAASTRSVKPVVDGGSELLEPVSLLGIRW